MYVCKNADFVQLLWREWGYARILSPLSSVLYISVRYKIDSRSVAFDFSACGMHFFLYKNLTLLPGNLVVTGPLLFRSAIQMPMNLAKCRNKFNVKCCSVLFSQ